MGRCYRGRPCLREYGLPFVLAIIRSVLTLCPIQWTIFLIPLYSLSLPLASPLKVPGCFSLPTTFCPF